MLGKLIGLSLLVFGLSQISAGNAADVPGEAVAPAAVVNVRLVDMGHTVDLSKNQGLGIGMKGDMSKAHLKIEADKFAVPAGWVTFKVANLSTDMEHEMLVVPINGMETPLPYVEQENRVDEKAAGDVGEVAELAPGKSGELTVELRPGLYALICNIPGHYAAGMWRVLAVQ